MDVIASPLITVLANLVADLLVSKGIIDSGSKMATIQLFNNIAASVMTLGVAVYSIYKVVELKKHQLTLAHTAPITTTTEKIEQISQEPSKVFTAPSTSQTGLVTPPVTGTNPVPDLAKPTP